MQSRGALGLSLRLIAMKHQSMWLSYSLPSASTHKSGPPIRAGRSDRCKGPPRRRESADRVYTGEGFHLWPPGVDLASAPAKLPRRAYRGCGRSASRCFVESAWQPYARVPGPVRYRYRLPCPWPGYQTPESRTKKEIPKPRQRSKGLPAFWPSLPRSIHCPEAIRLPPNSHDRLRIGELFRQVDNKSRNVNFRRSGSPMITSSTNPIISYTLKLSNPSRICRKVSRATALSLRIQRRSPAIHRDPFADHRVWYYTPGRPGPPFNLGVISEAHSDNQDISTIFDI